VYETHSSARSQRAGFTHPTFSSNSATTQKTVDSGGPFSAQKNQNVSLELFMVAIVLAACYALGCGAVLFASTGGGA